ncbi:hypothetical protein GXW78_01430 [Roseomonas terrae]|uniref:HIRAN domain-containing protein n=1 Tax=Neoroseomonas terrae TaxID=424799 RepID=A0ABS5EBB9_9PROT|nr:hypothetical protein [Neoroseomonas terrae]MBR0648311.1 hypothetical protein [Neoroseomonas terrae]
MSIAETSYLLGLGELARDPAALISLQVGARLRLGLGMPSARGAAAAGWRRLVEVRGPNGRAVGYLPPDDAWAVAGLLEKGACVTARVTALVPAFRRGRVQLAIEVERGPVSGQGG